MLTHHAPSVYSVIDRIRVRRICPIIQSAGKITLYLCKYHINITLEIQQETRLPEGDNLWLRHCHVFGNKITLCRYFFVLLFCFHAEHKINIYCTFFQSIKYKTLQKMGHTLKTVQAFNCKIKTFYFML